MMGDKVTETLLDVLKQAVAEPGEQRLYKSGKLNGLFSSRAGVNGEAAGRALRDGLLEVVRTEVKGKTTIEWVRPTPRGIEFLHEHESPVQTLRELQAVLQSARDGVPLWLADMRRELQLLADRLAQEAQRWSHRFDALGRQVEEALRRAELATPGLPDGMGADAAWAQQLLAYMDHRVQTGAAPECSLPELFRALQESSPDVVVPAFHDRLRRLKRLGYLDFLPFPPEAGEMPEPEYALLEGSQVYYYARRSGRSR